MPRMGNDCLRRENVMRLHEMSCWVVVATRVCVVPNVKIFVVACLALYSIVAEDERKRNTVLQFLFFSHFHHHTPLKKCLFHTPYSTYLQGFTLLELSCVWFSLAVISLCFSDEFFFPLYEGPGSSRSQVRFPKLTPIDIKHSALEMV